MWLDFEAKAGAVEALAPSSFILSGIVAALRDSHGTEISVSEANEKTDSWTIPWEFTLSQNYPNPFNPTTRIRYSVANREHVSLKVYDALGEEVASLVNAEMVPGSYEARIDAGILASGMYLYRLQTPTAAITRKMMLLK